MPDGVAYPFDPLAETGGFRAPRVRSAALAQPPIADALDLAEACNDAATLNLLLGVVAALEQGCPAVRDCLRGHRAEPADFPLKLDAPFGVDGPATIEVGGLRALLYSPAMIYGVMRVSDPGRLLLDYTRAMMGFLLLCSAPLRIEMIGLGAGSLVRYCRRHLPDTDIVAVEIDPRVIALRDRFAVPADDDRFRVVEADGADFVRDDDGRPDVILVDAFGAGGHEGRLASSEFYTDCRKRLNDDGVLVVNLCDNLLVRRIAMSRLRRVFGSGIAVVPIDGQRNRVVFASRNPAFLRDTDRMLRAAATLDARHGVNFPKLARRIAKGIR